MLLTAEGWLLLASICFTTIAELSRCVGRFCVRKPPSPRPTAASLENPPCAQPISHGVSRYRRIREISCGDHTAASILRPSPRHAAPGTLSYLYWDMTKRPVSPSTCCTPRPACRVAHTHTPNTGDLASRVVPLAVAPTDCKVAERTVWCVDLIEEDAPGGACCFKQHSHNIWSRNKVAKAMCAIRHAYEALVQRGNFTFDNIRLNRVGQTYEDPMGTLVAAMTLLKWKLNYQHLLEHNLNYETRRLCAASLFLTHKLKSEDGWGVGPGMPMAACVLGEFLSKTDIYTHSTSKQTHDMFATEMQLLVETPVYSLADENVQSATEMALTRLMERGLLDEKQADAALRRVFIYFYAASVLPDRDVFEDAMQSMSTGQMGQAMARTVLRGTAAHAHLDGLPLEVLAFSEVLVECLRLAPTKACNLDNKFLSEMHKKECARVGTDYVTLDPRFFVHGAMPRTTVTHILVDL